MSRIVDAMMAGQRHKLAARLKDNNDPNAVVDAISEVVQANLKAQAHGNALVKDKALGDLNMTLKMIRTNQANVGPGNRDKYISILNRSLEESTKSISEIEDTASSMRSVSDAMTDVLPSPDSLINALTVANPLVGHGVKMVKQMAVGALKTTMDGKKSRQKQLDILQQEADTLAGITPEQEEQTEAAKQTAARNSTIIGELKLMNEQFASLYDIWADDVVDSIDNVKDSVDKQTTENARLEERRLRAERENKREGIEDQPTTTGPTTEVPADPELTDGIATFLGSFAGGSLSKLGGLLGGIGRFALFATKAVGIGALLTGAYTFFDGFFNAADILGMDETKIGFTDRIRAGIGSLGEGLAESLNGIANFLGFEDLVDTEDLSTRIATGIEDLGKSIGGMIYDAQQYLTGMWDSVTSTWDSVTDLFSTERSPAEVKSDIRSKFGIGMDTQADQNTQDVRDVVVDAVETYKKAEASVVPQSIAEKYSTTGNTFVTEESQKQLQDTLSAGAEVLTSGQSASLEFMEETKKARAERTTDKGNDAPLIVAPSTSNSTVINQTHTTEVSSPRNNEPIWERGSLGRGLGYM